MANKLGILNGFFLFFLNFFAIIPLGIYFAAGIVSYTGIPLYYINFNNVEVYTWGIVDLITPSSTWWFNLPGMGIVGFIFIQIFLLFACILTIFSSMIDANGVKGLVISIILMLLSIIFIIIDVLVMGTLTGAIIPVVQILPSLGMGFYLLIITFILEIFVIRIQSAMG